MRTYDSIIIGFGKGGKTLAGWLGSQGKSVALIEQSPEMFGGTCINVGCIPSKFMVEQSHKIDAQKSFEEKSLQYADAVARKRQLVGMLRGKNKDKLVGSNVELIVGRASFEGQHQIKVELPDGETIALTGEKIFINTGAQSIVPSIDGMSKSSRVYTSTGLLDLDVLPRRLVILGASYIALEFASIFARFGSEVTVLQRGTQFLAKEDADVAQAIKAGLEEQGVTILEGVQLARIEPQTSHDVLHLRGALGEKTIEAEALLVATGRRPNTEGLNLKAAGVDVTDKGGILVDEENRTTAGHIFAMGDVTGKEQFTYISLDDFRIVKSALEGKGQRTTMNRGEVPNCVFIDPPFSRVGLTEKEAREKFASVLVATMPTAAIPKSHILGNTAGMLKMIVDGETNEILGAHFYCVESHEMINLVKLAMDQHIPYTVLQNFIFTHPTMSESINDLLGLLK